MTELRAAYLECLKKCFAEADAGEVSEATAQETIAIEESIGSLEVFDTLAEIGIIDAKVIAREIDPEAETVPDDVKDFTVGMMVGSGATAINSIVSEYRKYAPAYETLRNRLAPQ
jgi:hypothetical protein